MKLMTQPQAGRPIAFDLRTANGSYVRNMVQGTILPSPESGPWTHGRITTANDSLFGSTHLSVGMTTYATGWSDPEGYDRLVEFIAPNVQAPAELFEHSVFINAEEFLSDGTNDDLRAINADFKSVDYTPGKVQRKVLNRGLRIELDWDRIKNDPIWQQRYTGKLLSRLKRNQARRAMALAVASGAADTLTWSSTPSALPDVSLNAEKILCGDSSGINPNRILIGENAWQTRISCLGSISSGANAYAAAAELQRTADDVGAFLGMESLLDSGRYQNGTSKTQIVGSYIILFNGKGGVDLDDPSNFKLAWVPCQTGQRYAVYVRQISVKKWEIVVEHYEILFAATTLGCRVLTIANS